MILSVMVAVCTREEKMKTKTPVTAAAEAAAAVTITIVPSVLRLRETMVCFVSALINRVVVLLL
jgi:hypothetical protein